MRQLLTVRRQLSSGRILMFQTVHHQEDVSVTKMAVPTSVKNDRDIPFAVLPHSVKKAYIVHETTSSLPKILHKYSWLTKTVFSPSLPSGYSDVSQLPAGVEQALSQTLSQAVAFQKRYKNNDSRWFLPDRIRHGILGNFIRISLVSGAELSHLKPENSFLYYLPRLETHWPRNYQFFKTEFNPDYVFRTKGPLPLAEEPRALTVDEVESLPGPYDSYSLNVYRHPIVHLRNRPAMDNSKLNPVKHCHTSIVVKNQMISSDEFHAFALMTSFAQSIAQAQDAGCLHGTELKEPIVTQCIVTNGHQMSFSVYQLNTLLLMDDKGLWNRMWTTPVMDLYKRKVDYHPSVYEEANVSELDANCYAFQHFVNFFHRKTL